jgi:hypothetical protein
MERINPTGSVRIALLQWYVRVCRPAETLDPVMGGLVPGEPELVCQMFAGIEPLIGRPLLEQLAAGQVTNRIDHVVTCWYRPELSTAMFLEFDDGAQLRHLEILDIRDRGLAHRYQELYCQERV